MFILLCITNIYLKVKILFKHNHTQTSKNRNCVRLRKTTWHATTHMTCLVLCRIPAQQRGMRPDRGSKDALRWLAETWWEDLDHWPKTKSHTRISSMQKKGGKKRRQTKMLHVQEKWEKKFKNKHEQHDINLVKSSRKNYELKAHKMIKKIMTSQ